LAAVDEWPEGESEKSGWWLQGIQVFGDYLFAAAKLKAARLDDGRR